MPNPLAGVPRCLVTARREAFCALVAACALVAPALAQQPIAAPILKPFADNRQWLLVEDVRYTVGDTSVVIVVPSGFVTDFASIPQAFWSFGLSPNGRYSKAAIVHDFLYWSQGCTRLQADNLLLIAMKESKVEPATRDAIYDGVRVGGQAAWDGNARERRAGLPRVVPAGARAFGPDVLWDDYRTSLQSSGVADPSFDVAPGYCTLGDSTDVPAGDPLAVRSGGGPATPAASPLTDGSVTSPAPPAFPP